MAVLKPASNKPKLQATAAELETFRDITDDVIEGDFVPFSCHWNPHTIVTRNGEVLQIIKIVGFTHETAERADDTSLRADIREAITSFIDTTEYAIWIHTLRRRKSLRTPGTYPRDFSGHLNRYWNDKNDWDHQFVNEVYVTILREGESGKITDPKLFLRSLIPSVDARHREKFIDESCAKLDVVVGNILPVLERYGACLLTTVKREGVWYSEPSEFLGELITLMDNQFPVAEVDMSDYLTEYDVTFGFNTMEVRMRSDGRRRFGALLTIKEYRELPIESLDQLLHIPAEFILFECFDFQNSDIILKQFKYQKYLFNSGKANMLAERSGLNDILASNHNSPTDYGRHQLGLFLLADSVKTLERYVSGAARTLSQLGMAPMREDIRFEECYWAQLPGNFEFVRRMRPLNTARIGGFANLSNFPAGQKEGNHWGPAVTTFFTASHTPYFFNFHDAYKGHTLLASPAPSPQKALLLNFLLAESRKFGGPLFYFDKHRRSEIFLRSLGGEYYIPAAGKKVKPSARMTLNPFVLSDTPENRGFLLRWLMALASSGEAAFRESCESAINTLFDAPSEKRSLAHCVETIKTRAPEHASLFDPWIGNGAYAGTFTEVESIAWDKLVYGFEMGDIDERPEYITPIFAYLIHRITQILDGAPAIIVADDAAGMLGRIFPPSRLKPWLDTIHAKNGIVIFVAEDPQALAETKYLPILKDCIATQIHLPHDAVYQQYAEQFGLDEKEMAYAKLMSTEDGHFLLKRPEGTIVAELNLSGMTDILAVLSATDENIVIMEKVIETTGPDPMHWMPKFLELV